MKPRLSRLGAAFGLIHFFLVILVASLGYEGSWGYVFFVLPDLPVILIVVALNRLLDLDTAWPLLITLGTAWWYFIGHMLGRMLRR